MQESKLKAYLDGIDAGSINEDRRLEQLLAAEWESLDGAKEGGMEGYKLNERMESVVWRSPILSFEIERHGATCLGSKSAEVQAWQVNVSNRSALLMGARRRQLEPASARLDVKSLVEKVTGLIEAGQPGDFLTWSSPDKVKVEIGKLIPNEGPKQTVAGRRTRFSNALRSGLEARGWAEMPGKKWWFVRRCDT